MASNYVAPSSKKRGMDHVGGAAAASDIMEQDMESANMAGKKIKFEDE